MIRTRSSAVFACAAKACAPPPVGTGGSLSSGARGKGRSAGKSAGKSAKMTSAVLTKESARINRENQPLAKVIGTYIDDGYIGINRALRNPRQEFLSSIYLYTGVRNRAELDALVKTMVDGFKDAPQITSDTALFRGIEGWVNLKVGSEITDKGFVSTSLSEKAARSVSGGDSNNWTLFRITAKKGTAYLPGSVDEQELILAPRSRFKVTGKSEEKVGGVTKYVYDLELL